MASPDFTGWSRISISCTRPAHIVVVAGMEGALPSAIGGLVDRPVIGVPTSVGYGVSFGSSNQRGLRCVVRGRHRAAGHAELLRGVSVVNIDNGYGAAVQASQINHLVAKGH